MEITTVIACKVQCDFCPQDLLINKYSSINKTENVNYGSPIIMSFETFKTCLDKIPNSVHIAFSGYGEPFLNPECTKMIIYAYDSGYNVQVFSTLVGLTTENIEQFKHIPFEKFHVHLPDEEMFAKIAVNENFLDVLKKLLTSNIKNLTGMSMGFHHPKMKEILDTHIVPSEMISRAGNVEIVKNKFEKKLGPLVCNRASKAGLVDRIDENVLLPNGDVTLCCNDYGLQNILGNLIKSDYSNLFHNEEYTKIYEKMKSQDSDIICRNCHESISLVEFNKRKDAFNKDYSNDKTALSIINLYQSLLERFPDKPGFDFFYSKISNEGSTTQDVENSIKQSSEYISIHPPKLKLRYNLTQNKS